MILEQFFEDCEQATVSMRLIPSSLQQISLVISGAPHRCHHMFSKPAAGVFTRYVFIADLFGLTVASIWSHPDWSKLSPLAWGLKHNSGLRSARVLKIVRRRH
jgi:hypothetical protein